MTERIIADVIVYSLLAFMAYGAWQRHWFYEVGAWAIRAVLEIWRFIYSFAYCLLWDKP